MNTKPGTKTDIGSARKTVKEPTGTHPLGTGIGAAGGAVAGAAVGTVVGGPAGAVVGGAIGAATGALTGRSVAEAVDPTVEEAYWSTHYRECKYVDRNRPYADYQPAYRYGWESRSRLGGRLFGDVESDLERGWAAAKGTSKLAWTEAKDATRDAWRRLESPAPR